VNGVRSQETRLAAAVVALEAIEQLVGDAVDKKIRTGRLPPLGKLLSEIQDTAHAALEEVRA
jgi:hypothetical protein